MDDTLSFLFFFSKKTPLITALAVNNLIFYFFLFFTACTNAFFTAITVISEVNSMKPADIAKTVRYFRKESGLTQQQLAELAGVGKTVLFDIEKGKESVQLNTLLKVLEALNIQIKLETPFAGPKENSA